MRSSIGFLVPAIAGLALGLAGCVGSGGRNADTDPPPAIAAEDASAGQEQSSTVADAAADSGAAESLTDDAETAAEPAEAATVASGSLAEAAAPDDDQADISVDEVEPTPVPETFEPSVAACGPAGTVATAAPAGGTTSGSLFDVASAADATGGDDQGRIAVAPARGRSFFRFGNPYTAPRSRGTTGRRRTSLNAAALAGTWKLADGTPGCGCSVTLETGDGFNPAQASGCSASGMDRLTNWRVRGSEIVLLAADRTLLGSLFSDDGTEFRGGLSNGTRAILWR